MTAGTDASGRLTPAVVGQVAGVDRIEDWAGRDTSPPWPIVPTGAIRSEENPWLMTIVTRSTPTQEWASTLRIAALPTTHKRCWFVVVRSTNT